MLVKIILKSTLAAASFTLMMVALVYTFQAREARDAVPRLIGQQPQEVPFLQDYTSTRQEMVFDFLRKNVPGLALPEPKAEPIPPSSLQALQERTRQNALQ